MNEIAITLDGDSAALVAEQHRAKAATLKVVDDLNHEEAVEIVTEIHTFLANVDEQRVLAIKPHLDAQRAINAKAKQLAEVLAGEKTRINRLIGDYGALLAARVRAEQAKLMEERSVLEQERNDKIAVAETLEEVDQIREDHSRQVAAQEIAVSQIVPTVKVKEDWEIEVIDAAALYKAHPEAVELKPRLSIIKALATAKNGALPGVICRRVNVARTAR